MTLPPLLLVFALFTLNPITISVYPAHAFAPASFRITVMVPRHADNRQACWHVDGPEKKGSCIDLAGLDARRVWTMFWNLRSPGEYEATAILTRSAQGTDKQYRSVQPFRVLGMEP